MQENLRKQNTKPTTPEEIKSYKNILYELFSPYEPGTSHASENAEMSDRSDYETEKTNRLPNIINIQHPIEETETQLPTSIFSTSFTAPLPLAATDTSFASADDRLQKTAATSMQVVPSMSLVSSTSLPIPSTQYNQYLSAATYANTLTTPNNLFVRPTAMPFIRPTESQKNGNDDSNKAVLSTVAKLPLQFTKSMEEMLKPPGQPEDAWNRPLGNDWANGMTTPNKEIVAHFFPECADTL